jgi:hypothetical protein
MSWKDFSTARLAPYNISFQLSKRMYPVVLIMDEVQNRGFTNLVALSPQQVTQVAIAFAVTQKCTNLVTRTRPIALFHEYYLCQQRKLAMAHFPTRHEVD